MNLVAACLNSGGNNGGFRTEPVEHLVAHCLARSACGSYGRYDPNGEDYIVTPPLTSNPYGDHESREGLPVAHSLRADGFDASEDGTGRGTPLVPVAYQCHGSNVGPMGHLRAGNGNSTGDVPFVFDTTQVTSDKNYSNPKPGDPCHPLAAGAHPPAVAFQTRIARNGRGQPEEVCPTLQGAGAGATSDMRPCVATPMAVRRLTPRECERLQGFPDDWTLIDYSGKPAADGPRYRAIGNSMAVPVMRWIGERIQQVTEATDG